MIRLELRCRSRDACRLALVRTDDAGRLVADVKVHYWVPGDEDRKEWSVSRYTVEITDDYLLLGCPHLQGWAEHPDAIRSYIHETPTGVRLLG